jgi:hypothetical protein
MSIEEINNTPKIIRIPLIFIGIGSSVTLLFFMLSETLKNKKWLHLPFLPEQPHPKNYFPLLWRRAQLQSL